MRFRPSLPFGLLVAFLIVLWIAGGASRADAIGQIVARSAAFICLVAMILFGERPRFASTRPVWLLLAGALALGLLQLVPLPPSVWQGLPGRALFVEAAAASGQAQPWRPWSIVPGATLNAVASLVVPIAALLLVSALRPEERQRLPALLLGFVVASTLFGLLQFSGAGVNNIFVNDTPGVMSGTLANRNHFALLLALGCLLVPVWVFREGQRRRWRGAAGLGLLLLFALAILGTGSRAGMALGGLALMISVALGWKGLRRELRHAPRWVLPALVAFIALLFISLVLISIAADRAVAIQRSFAIDVEQDMRSRALPTVVEMVRTYFPFGSGLGGFDPMFRIAEPFALLKPTYFNHAHNDLLEIVLDAGVPGLLLLLAGLAWWGWASIKAWRAGGERDQVTARLGGAMLLLVIIASAFDYPARTPIIMAWGTIAAVWLADAWTAGLPRSNRHL
jgi:O-antigen ligase